MHFRLFRPNHPSRYAFSPFLPTHHHVNSASLAPFLLFRRRFQLSRSITFMDLQIVGNFYVSPIRPSSQANPAFRTDGVRRCDHVLVRPSPFPGPRLLRVRSVELLRPRGRQGGSQPLRRVCSASFEPSDDDEDEDEDLIRRIEDLAIELRMEKGQGGREELEREKKTYFYTAAQKKPVPSPSVDSPPPLPFHPDSSSPAHSQWLHPSPWPRFPPQPPEYWSNLTVPACVEKNANGLRIPMSLRFIQLKKRFDEGWFCGAGETACCSMKRAFSSMVFMLQELQTYALQLREVFPCENHPEIIPRLHRNLNHSFVWLFQQIFYATPTLMVSVMLLLANFTVYSMDCFNIATATTLIDIVEEDELGDDHLRDRSSLEPFASIGRGGGGHPRPASAGSTDDGRSDHESPSHPANFLPEDEGGVGVPSEATPASEVTVLWERFLEEFAKLQASTRHEALMDPETLRSMVAPVSVELQAEEQPKLLHTEMMYEQALSQDPNNALLLSNFAQFLFLVLRQHDRAEESFLKAMKVAPGDAETLSRYATFLWVARKDLSAAEETFLGAIEAEPENTVHRANYAHFLWSTGGEDTCYPLAYDVNVGLQ
ncbi:uncharacterized protein LOC122002699 [Zingiber officinale]|uniref:Uncharacterized protein n=1 Tax=Zingiber officinale TaxID=94328 RepID=A0A8J5FXR0_ZINOF|nr:uncharacterized protein LOC122002699 [Zingiber officinale]KAG6494137.1 hypothetical protein ZIOFF_049156 [Zingiber officinale]